MSSSELPLPLTLSAAHHRLDVAASKATELVQSYANVDDPYSTSNNNPWINPDRIFQELRSSRDELVQAWKDLEQETSTLARNRGDNNESNKLDPERCIALYMDMITDAFADTLDHMRKTEGDSLDVDLLVDCLQSGLDLLTNQEQEALFSNALDHEFDGEENEILDQKNNTVSCHESIRQQMGLDMPVLG